MTAVRSPRALAGAALVLAALGYAVLAAWRARAGLVPPADPWLVTFLVLLGLWGLLGAVLAEARGRVSRATLRREPGLPVVLDAAGLTGTPATDGPAWSLPETRAGWRSLRRGAWWPLAVAALLLAAVVLPVRTYAAGDAELGGNGIRVTGRVVDSGWDYAGRGGRPVADVAYAYGGHDLAARVDGPPPGTTPPGTQLALRVDPAQPDRVRAEGHPGTTAALEWWVSLCSLAALALAGLGAWRLWLLGAWRRRLQAEPWLAARLEAAPGGRSGAVLVSTSTARTVAHGRVASAADPDPDGACRVLPAPRGRRVLAEVPGGRQVQLRLPATAIEGRRWWRAVGGGASTATEGAASGARQQRDEEAGVVGEGAHVPGGEPLVEPQP